MRWKQLLVLGDSCGKYDHNLTNNICKVNLLWLGICFNQLLIALHGPTGPNIMDNTCIPWGKSYALQPAKHPKSSPLPCIRHYPFQNTQSLSKPSQKPIPHRRSERIYFSKSFSDNDIKGIWCSLQGAEGDLGCVVDLSLGTAWPQAQRGSLH